MEETCGRTIAAWVVVVWILAAGCSSEPDSGGSLDGVYGPPEAEPSAFISRARPEGAPADGSWTNAPFWFLQTELSPATLFHSRTKTLSFFTHLAEAGIGGPTFAVYNSEWGPRPTPAGTEMDASSMQECWVMVWFAGAQGWTNWDSPWVVYLQHKPASMKLDPDGLHFEFAREAGYVVLLPLYGYLKPPHQSREVLPGHDSPGSDIKTWEWQNRIPKEVFRRIRYWAAALREFPMHCDEHFSVNRNRDIVTIRSQMEWLSIDDDWQTQHLKLAPLSPPLALAWQENFPVEFSRRVFDLDFCTLLGPYLGVQDVDTFDSTFQVLRYVHETEVIGPPPVDASPSVRGALAKLRQIARGNGRPGLGDAGVHAQWYARALPWIEDPARRDLVAGLSNFFHTQVLVTNRPSEARFNQANLLQTLWAYAHFTGDWSLIRERWPLVQKLFKVPAAASWAGFGCESVAESLDEAGACVAMGRLAYRVGDIDASNYASYLFARELVHHWLKERGAGYFRRRQPWHSTASMKDPPAMRLRYDGQGWRMSGPADPAAGAGTDPDRWMGLADVEVARFYREHLAFEAQRELELLQSHWSEPTWQQDFWHAVPSPVQLRSLLANDRTEELARRTAPDPFTGPDPVVLGNCLAILRLAAPFRQERLIPGGSPSPFVTGLEREVSVPQAILSHSVKWNSLTATNAAAGPTWPEPIWPDWRTPTGARWSFGQVRPVPLGEPARARVVPLNWNTRAVVYELP